MEEVKLWVALGALSIVTIVLGYALAFWFKEIIKRLDNVVKELHELGEKNSAQQERITNIQDGQIIQTKRLNDHSARIRAIELKTR